MDSPLTLTYLSKSVINDGGTVMVVLYSAFAVVHVCAETVRRWFIIDALVARLIYGMNYYSYYVVEAHLHLTGWKEPPNLYVRAHFDDLISASARTRTIKKQFDPSWNEQFVLPARDMSSVLQLSLRHDRYFFGSQLLSTAEIELEPLLGKRRDEDTENIKIDLVSSKKKSNISLSGHITIRLRENENVSAGQLALDGLHIHSDERDPAMDSSQGNSPVGHILDRVDYVQSLSVIMSKLDIFMKIVDSASQINPYISIAWQITSSVYQIQIVKGQLDRDKKIEDLAAIMQDVYTFVDVVQSFPEKLAPLDDTIRKILAQTIECVMFIREYAGNGFGVRLLHSPWADVRIADFTQNFNLLKQSFNSGVVVQTAIVTFRIYDSVEKLVRAQNLSKLLPADMDDPSRTSCLPDTRIDVLTSIAEWATSPTTKENVLWLHGLAGSGKSTISTTVANFFRELRRLGAFTFFNRDITGRSDPAIVIRTLAYQLGEFDSRIGSAISKVIESTPSIKQSPIRWQFLKLLMEPLSSLETSKREGPIIIIIDALDECGHPGTRSELLKTFALELHKLPNTVRILITSRDEMDITEALGNQPHIVGRRLDISSRSNSEDVLIYLRRRMVEIQSQNKYLSLPLDWPGENNILALAARASGLFIWASTACRFIEDGQDPDERVTLLTEEKLYSDAESALDHIYETALNATGKWDDPVFASDFRDVIGMIIVAKNPLVAATVDALNADFTSSKKRRPALHTIQRLGCVLLWGQSEVIRIMHPSFADYLTNPARSGHHAWFIDRHSQHKRIAIQCLGHLRTVLKKIFVNLVDHLNLFDLVSDAVRFSQAFIMVIEHHPLLVYASALPFTPIMTALFQQFHETHTFPRVAGGFRQGWPSVLMEFPNQQGEITSLTFSPDGKHFLFTAANIINVWDATTGEDVVSPLKGHEAQVNMAVFSPSGLQIASCSEDNTVRLWNALSGVEVFEPLRGHRLPVWSVVFNPEGTMLLSGSKDSTIVAWDTRLGTMIYGPLTWHKKGVRCLAFSPDGSRFISGSNDATICIGDATTGTELFRLQQHSRAIYSVAYSPDGARILSSSDDKTLLLWDAHSGAPLLEPFRGHKSTVYSASFSPDGSQIVSASKDSSVRVWDASSGNQLTHLTRRHRQGVRCAAFSRDGTRVVSGSGDCTIRIWDAESVEGVGPARIHKSIVTSLAFSPDGTRLASGSLDKTIRVWDVASGTEVLGPLEGLDREVRSVSFSTDGSAIVAFSYGREPIARSWDSISGILLPESVRHILFRNPNPLSLEGNWIIDTLRQKPISMLPSSSPNTYSSFNNCMAIGTKNGSVLIINFPSS
ncbi:hypothetical protein SERLA73DRAFT_149548 [Serpula lacrymans var. lacrymans S7.3]|uniref:C2 domain-containing protein n=1 Tax=Serpula lacrymans var. lacrymans (strain S7.3) TaxID=936435 RepID=F8PGI3_SERL3|nr:hypothetical protein SERLA73DRAFT_149548 [Serpula lacrymans var. lacrymans S7.3]